MLTINNYSVNVALKSQWKEAGSKMANVLLLTKRKRDRGEEDGKELLRNLKNNYLVASEIKLSPKCFIISSSADSYTQPSSYEVEMNMCFLL